MVAPARGESERAGERQTSDAEGADKQTNRHTVGDTFVRLSCFSIRAHNVVFSLSLFAPSLLCLRDEKEKKVSRTNRRRLVIITSCRVADLIYTAPVALRNHRREPSVRRLAPRLEPADE